MAQIAGRRIRWQRVVLFRNWSKQILEGSRALAIGSEFFINGEDDHMAGVHSEGVVPSLSDVELVVMLEADVAVLAGEFRRTADRLMGELDALRSQFFPIPLTDESAALFGSR